MARYSKNTALMDPSMRLRDQLLMRKAQQDVELRNLTPRERAELAKQRLRVVVGSVSVQRAARRRPYLWLGVALATGVLLGAVPGARRIAIKSLPAFRKMLSLLNS